METRIVTRTARRLATFPVIVALLLGLGATSMNVQPVAAAPIVCHPQDVGYPIKSGGSIKAFGDVLCDFNQWFLESHVQIWRGCNGCTWKLWASDWTQCSGCSYKATTTAQACSVGGYGTYQYFTRVYARYLKFSGYTIYTSEWTQSITRTITC